MALENPFIDPPKTEGERKFKEEEALARADAAQRAKEAQKRAGKRGQQSKDGGNAPKEEVDLTEALGHALDPAPKEHFVFYNASRVYHVSVHSFMAC